MNPEGAFQVAQLTISCFCQSEQPSPKLLFLAIKKGGASFDFAPSKAYAFGNLFIPCLAVHRNPASWAAQVSGQPKPEKPSVALAMRRELNCA